MKPSHSPSAQASVVLHRLALRETQRHLGQRRLAVDLLGDLRRRRRGCDRQRLMIIGVRIVIERALRRPFLRPSVFSVVMFA